MKEGGKINIWEEMEEDMGKKYGHTEKGYQKPPAIMEVYAMQDVNIFEVIFVFMKYVIKHCIKQISNLLQVIPNAQRENNQATA